MDRTTLSQIPPLSGVVSLRRRIASTALEVFAGWSYREIDVPLLDYFDPLRRVLDPKQVNRMFRLVDRDGNLLVLRGDVTPAIAKIYAYQLGDMPLPLRVCYANKVVRIERAFTREQIEAYQLGVELIGSAGPGPEIEVLLVALETLKTIGVDDFEVHLGDAALADRLVVLSGAGARLRDELLTAISERDPTAVRQLSSGLTCDRSVIDALLAMTRLGFDQQAIREFAAAAPKDERLTQALDSLQALLDTLAGLGLSQRVHVDLGVVNDQGYYTGTSFKIVSERVGRVLGGGGRYDDLIGRFGKDTPAVGFSLSLEALLELLEPGDEAEASQSAASVQGAGNLVTRFKAALTDRAGNRATAVGHEE